MITPQLVTVKRRFSNLAGLYHFCIRNAAADRIKQIYIDMNKYFNIQTVDGVSTIFLYGDISDYGDVSSARVAAELLEAEQKSSRINVRINSVGGDVYCGITIFNALKSSKADIHIYIDGIAASMAGVIALCGKHVEMSKYARLMLHNVSGGCYGNKSDLQKCIKEIEALEDSLGDICAGKLGKTKEEVVKTYFDGEDHWFTADEALALGFIDAIYDAEPVPADSTPEQIYAEFNNRLIKPQNRDNMNLEELRKHPHFKNCANDEAILAEVDKLVANAAKLSELTKTNEALTAKIKDFEAKAEAAAEAERKSLLDAAEKDGRIDATTRPTFENILKDNMENGKAALAALTPKRNVFDDINHGQGNGPEEGAWERRQREIREKNMHR
jgi:ATP-dependent Clp endopeptidase proteolytic subunit ClpP